jgi:hypothetical protein
MRPLLRGGIKGGFLGGGGFQKNKDSTQKALPYLGYTTFTLTRANHRPSSSTELEFSLQALLKGLKWLEGMNSLN